VTTKDDSGNKSNRELVSLEMYTLQETAAMFKINVRTLHRMIHSGEIPAVRISRRWRFTRTIIDEYLKKNGSGC
jgi:excisionase family DNA binding protein